VLHCQRVRVRHYTYLDNELVELLGVKIDERFNVNDHVTTIYKKKEIKSYMHYSASLNWEQIAIFYFFVFTIT